MTPRRVAEAGGTGGRVGLTALLLVVAAVGMLLLVRAQPDPEPFDPRSEAGSGTRGLVVLLQHEGAEVAVVRSAPDPGGDQRVLVLQDRLNDGQRRDLLAFVEAGGVVVMADPLSSLAGDIGPVATVTDELPAFDGNELAGLKAPLLQNPLGSYLGFNERYVPQQKNWVVAETPLVGEWRNLGLTVWETSLFAVGGWSGDFLNRTYVFDALPFRVFIPAP